LHDFSKALSALLNPDHRGFSIVSLLTKMFAQ